MTTTGLSQLSQLSQLLPAHEHDLGGGFIVRRLLPAAVRQSVGPFVFFDHFGPITIEPGKGNNVRPHPHIGLATVTYLFDGAIVHRDSLGTTQQIEPGDINWMTAGSGIVHSEREPEALQGTTYCLHGLQLWVALPIDQEEVAPNFIHTSASQIPALQVDDAEVRVLIGAAFGKISPVATFSNTLYLDIQLPENGTFTLPPLAAEMAVYALESDLTIGENKLFKYSLGVIAPGSSTRIHSTSKTRLIVLGGEPLESKRWIWWNFVSSRKERIDQAAKDWQEQRMGSVAGDPEFIPLPPTKKTS
ncbi:pirin family protein [Solimicrobium silvestre]|uniref:Pirin-related protein n=1 Tax=Solimicrobium silvestre TaxID=2099400 RepID=A0A2S9GZ25_9BURK|nr:pirin family protein [Solimicrobium silvestre]PRC92984.1 Pirin-related protein [Solimicrobium silvestre]